MAKKQKEPVSLTDVPEEDLRAELNRRRVERIRENNQREQLLAQLTTQYADVLVRFVPEHAKVCTAKFDATPIRYDAEHCSRCALLELERAGYDAFVADIVIREIRTEDEV